MTLGKFQRLLKLIHPKLRIRQRGYGDIGGLFVGLSGKSGYIARITKGELQLHGYRFQVVDPSNNLRTVNAGGIQKRGRKTLINLLRNWRWIKNHYQVSMLLHGYIPDPEKVRLKKERFMPLN